MPDSDPLDGTGLTPEGFVAPREDELKAYIRTTYEELTGESPEWEETQYLGAASAAKQGL